MTDPNYVVHVAFYDEATEQHRGSVDHPHPPSVGDVVWCEWWDAPEDEEGNPLADPKREMGAFEVVRRQWHHPGIGSPAYLDGKRGGMLDCLVRPTKGLFR